MLFIAMLISGLGGSLVAQGFIHGSPLFTFLGAVITGVGLILAYNAD
jgi:hypothetical protein